VTAKTIHAVYFCVLTSLILCQPVPGAFGQPQHLLIATIEAEPPAEVFSFGIYDTVFPIRLVTHVCNDVASEDFPGGNITGAITPPSGDRYSTSLRYPVTNLASGACTSFVTVFKPIEPGVHIVHFDSVSTQAFYNPAWQVSGGLVALDVEPASTIIELWSLIAALAVGFSSIVVAVVFPIYQERRRQRRLNNRQRQKAYAHLYAILERHATTPSTTTLQMTMEDFKELQKTVEDNFDVLYESTLTSWRNRRLEKHPTTIRIEAGAFFGDILNHYARLDKGNPRHNLDSQ
jgi:hypothetical protein